MRFIILINFAVLTIVACGQIPDPLRNHIVLTNKVEQVADSILKLEILLKKLPRAEIINTFIDRDEYLYVNSKKLGLLEGAIGNKFIRDDAVFASFNNDDYRRFISITIFLLKNNINGSRRDNISGLFVHEYRITEEYRYQDLRYIMVNINVTAPEFVRKFQILDKNGNLILTAPKDVNVR